MLFVASQESFSSCFRDFCPFFLIEVFQFCEIPGSSCVHSSFEVCPQIFNEVQVRRLLGSWQNLQLTPLHVVHRLRCDPLSIYRSHPLFNYSFFKGGVMFSSRICWDLIESILPSTRENVLVPLAVIQPQIMIDPTPCLIVGLVPISWNAVPFVLQIYLLSFFLVFQTLYWPILFLSTTTSYLHSELRKSVTENT